MDPFVGGLIHGVGSTLGSLLADEAVRLLQVGSELEKLNTTVDAIARLLGQMEAHDVVPSVNTDYMRSLMDVLFDAQDILDLCQAQAEEKKKHTGDDHLHMPFHLHLDLHFTHSISHRMHEVNEKLDKTNKQFQNLKAAAGGGRTAVRPPSSSQNTCRLIVKKDMVWGSLAGEVEKMVEVLTEEDGRENVLVVAIVGAPGVGKSALAKAVFDSEKLQQRFEKKIWVSFDRSFNEDDEVNLLRSAIAEAGEESDPPETASVVRARLQEFLSTTPNKRAALQPLLEKAVKEKRILVVMDNVWSCRAAWEKLLRKPLMSAAFGSRVLVTTRNEAVAREMRAVHFHRVQRLPLEEGWSLLKKQVNHHGDATTMDELKEVGMEIVNRCNGLPLIIEAVGRKLRRMGHATRTKWNQVLDMAPFLDLEVQEGSDLLNSLNLSLEDLQPHELRRSFVYCSLLPPNQVIMRDKVIQLWIAEGFIKNSSSSSIPLEEIGEQYFDELMARNLLEQEEGSLFGNACFLQPPLSDLAYHVLKDLYCLTVAGEGHKQDLASSNDKLRRLCMVDNKVDSHIVNKQKRLRTLILFRCTGVNHLAQECWHHHNPHLAFLRVVDMSSSDVTSLPEEFCRLPLLRLLDLSGSAIATLPKNIGELNNLLFLGLMNCAKLLHLPESIVHLSKLRSLRLSGTSLEGFPRGLQNLTSISELTGYVPRNQDQYSSIMELNPLMQIRTLELEGLEKVEDAHTVNLSDKSYLGRLMLACSNSTNGHACSQDMVEIFNELCPPDALESLTIRNYYADNLPRWMTTTLHNLRHLMLEGYWGFKTLAPLGQIPHLDILKIKGGPLSNGTNKLELFGCDDQANDSYPNLTTLELDSLHELEEWVWEKSNKAMPNLITLKIIHCPELSTLPVGLQSQATALRYLHITGANSLRSIESIHSLWELHLSGNKNLVKLFDLPDLKDCKYHDCPNLKEAIDTGAWSL